LILHAAETPAGHDDAGVAAKSRTSQRRQRLSEEKSSFRHEFEREGTSIAAILSDLTRTMDDRHR
jgi:hypothetical protein